MAGVNLFPWLGEPMGTASFSACGTYRYRLTRNISEASRVLNFLMLNPSTADAEKPDPTITRCMGYCRSFGYSDLVVTNLYALRSTDPRGLWTHASPIGPDNDQWLKVTATEADLVICAWGNHGKRNGRGDAVLRMLRENGVTPHRLGPLTKEGQPNHPLYLKATLTPEPI